MVKDMDTSLFEEKILDLSKGEDAQLIVDKDTIIEFWVTWCPHCKAMKEPYEHISEMFKEIDCYRIEMEQYPDLANIFEVESFPTFVFIRKDGDVEKWVGEVPEEDLINITKKAFGMS